MIISLTWLKLRSAPYPVPVLCGVLTASSTLVVSVPRLPSPGSETKFKQDSMWMTDRRGGGLELPSSFLIKWRVIQKFPYSSILGPSETISNQKWGGEKHIPLANISGVVAAPWDFDFLIILWHILNCERVTRHRNGP